LLCKELNERMVARAGISPDDLLIQLYELPGREHLVQAGPRAARLRLSRELNKREHL
jgi:hypothetical protein